MATRTKTATAKPEPAAPVEVTDLDEAEPTFVPDGPESSPEAAMTPAADGYLWVTRKRPVQLMGKNPQWEKPTLIDAKSFPELEAQGWRVADGPDADGPSEK